MISVVSHLHIKVCHSLRKFVHLQKFGVSTKAGICSQGMQRFCKQTNFGQGKRKFYDL